MMTLAWRWRNEVRRDARLTAHQRLVASEIGDRVNADGSNFYVGAQRVAVDLQLDRGTVTETYHRLEELGYWSATGRARRATVYRLSLPSAGSASTRAADGPSAGPADTRSSAGSSAAPSAGAARTTQLDSEKLALAELDQDELIEAGRRKRPELTGGQVAAQLVVFSEGNVGTKRTEDGWRKGWLGWIWKYDPAKDKAKKLAPLRSYTEPPRPDDESEYTWGTGCPDQEAAGGLR